MPIPKTSKVASPVPTLGRDTKVSELINQSNGNWKTELINQTFWPIQAFAICNLPLSKNSARDKWIWYCTTNSQFTVRSAYKVTVASDEFRLGELGESSGKSGVDLVRKKICSSALGNQLLARNYVWKVTKRWFTVVQGGVTVVKSRRC
ncbi:hypothetical protein ACH5RR_041014 [Cinchona calisaya]|uniref:Uncharacterized protein n=1 Tax=Cinchona calisaya TaxID=153742 RepID=A0ABD2XSR9_9GENT